MKIHFALLIALGIVTTSCVTPRTVQYRNTLDDSVTADSRATIFLMRKNTFQAGGVPMLAFDGDTPIGSYGSHGCLEWTRPPGKVEVRAVAIRGSALRQVMATEKSVNEIIALYGLLNRDNTPMVGRIAFDARPGQTYYILQTTDVPGLGSGRNIVISLEIASEIEGQKHLKERKPATK